MNSKPSEIDASLRQLMPEARGHAATAIQFLIAHRDEIPFRSMRELAKRARVPSVTLVRLAQNLGFKGFDEFREVHITELISGKASNRGRAAQLVTLGQEEGALGFAAKFAEREIEVQRAAIDTLNEKQLEGAVQALVDASRVYVIGRRPFFAPAYSLAYSLRKAKPNTYLLDTGGGSGLELNDLTQDDVVIGFTSYPYSRVTSDVAKNAKGQGATVIAVTDSENAPIAQYSGYLFLMTARSYAFPDSVAGAYIIANILVALTVSRLGADALARIQRNELEIRETGEYLAEPARRSKAVT
ncbi:MurR/RpiR family transcriptional regulator [Mesorhizobium sp. M1396]|uniref:MurR/RpiR family transcriptional regulator n=1 Tax=Mesorhizobium sp. M1396 TaxID=2957095 RepID=UPI00333BC4A0